MVTKLVADPALGLEVTFALELRARHYGDNLIVYQQIAKLR